VAEEENVDENASKEENPAEKDDKKEE